MIKMRNNKSDKAKCCECNSKANEVLNMYDICIGGNIFTICDRCNEDLMNKTLKAECVKNNRLKSQHDMNVIRKRRIKMGIKNENHLTINEAMED